MARLSCDHKGRVVGTHKAFFRIFPVLTCYQRWQARRRVLLALLLVSSSRYICAALEKGPDRRSSCRRSHDLLSVEVSCI